MERRLDSQIDSGHQYFNGVRNTALQATGSRSVDRWASRTPCSDPASLPFYSKQRIIAHLRVHTTISDLHETELFVKIDSIFMGKQPLGEE